jgi:hypothetical protein
MQSHNDPSLSRPSNTSLPPARLTDLARLVPQKAVKLLPGLSIWAVLLVFLALVQFSTPDLPGNDGYYHIKLAYLMRTEGLKPDFRWLPLSILNPREFYDHHFLFHVALIPFTYGDLRLGAKWASVIFASIAFLAVWRLLRNQRVPYAWLWSLGLLAVSEAFIFRMSITRAQSLSLFVLVIGLDWLLTGRHRRLILLAFAYVWLYNAFPLLLGLAGIYVVSVWLSERRLDLRPVFYTGVGLLLGLVINPYFPFNIIFAYLHILPKLVEATSVSVGSEWYPYNTSQLLSNSPLALIAFAGGALALGLSGRSMPTRTSAAFLLACMFGLMLFQSRRFVEYFPAFALVFAAFSWTPVLIAYSQRYQSGSENTGFANRLPLYLRRHLPAAVLAAFLIPGSLLTFIDARENISGSKPYTFYRGAAAWLESNTPPGRRVFQTDWDDFPRLFFYNTHNTYLVGLDPTYLQLYNAELYDEWVDITQGRVERPSRSIEARFGGQYVITDHQHGSFIDRAAVDPGLVEVYRDNEAIVYRVESPSSP